MALRQMQPGGEMPPRREVILAIAFLAFLSVPACGDTTPRPPTATPIPATAYVRVEGKPVCTYKGSLEAWLCEGEIKNTGTRPLRFVAIRATVLGTGGSVLATDSAYIDSDRLLGGATSIFYVYVDDPGGRDASRHIAFEIDGAQFAD
jgi:hypothetical protein